MGAETTVTRKRRIFISYQRQHEEDIVALVKVLEQDEVFEVWYDRKIKAGKWWDQIIKHIEWADVVILALSRSYFDSEACRLERLHAIATNRAILPVIVDGELSYDTIPREIAEYQIERYTGQAKQYVDLRNNLLSLPQNSLPNPVPDPPVAPINTPRPASPAPPSPPTLRLHAVRDLVVGGLLLLVIALAILLVIASASPDPDPNPANQTFASSAAEDSEVLPTTAAMAASPTPPAESPQVPGGAVSVTLIYGERSSLAIVVNDATDFSGVTLQAFDPEYETTLTDDFPALQATDARIGGGTCLIYEVDGSQARRPQACDDAQILLAPLQPADVFWFNDGGNRFVDIAIYRAGTLLRLCGHANGSGRCEVVAEPT